MDILTFQENINIYLHLPAYFYLDKLNSGYLSNECKLLSSTRGFYCTIFHIGGARKKHSCSVPNNK